eukprot:Unigene4464_Nuclearia_a/m.13639 Unigene4464_Nuclearia_a/g.13639  ORF Unigene4464_Nuclearia_a/g.13639 Unigene4464_Nuclearia_a/m.13639 type:complete len:525 (-) Unigene4464_Nuclearia_a:55-1629(-)
MAPSEPSNLGAVYDSVLILDFGSQFSHLITRRVRELGVYCELHPCTVKLADVPFKPKGVILSGGPSSVYEKDAPRAPKGVWELGVPILGICYGLQEMAWSLGGEVLPSDKREYGHADVRVVPVQPNALFEGLEGTLQVWMSHGDQLSKLPQGFEAVAATETAPFAAVANHEKRMFGVQFHPEVTHTPQGKHMLHNFVRNVCGCRPEWTMTSFIDREIERIRNVVGPAGHVIGAVSGGVDSTVAAALMTRAIGERFHAILVDNGLLRLNEATEAYHKLREQLGVNVNVVDASQLFLSRLNGVTDPERKRKIIGNTFIEVFEVEAKKVGDAEFLLQGTLYPDVIESISFKGPSATIKTHHNVGGLLDVMKLKLIEPLRELFKDEVRALGELLGLDEASVWRHPFPGPGLAIRVLGEVTAEQCRIAREADAIFIEEIRRAGLYRQISQAFCVLLPVRSVGVMGDHRTYEQVIAVRAVETSDFMTADWFPMPYDVLKRVSTRIINEVKGVNRVTYDVSSKPPATIEWE